MWKVFLLGSIQAFLFFGLICWISCRILPKTDLHPFFYRNFFKQIAYPGVIGGILVGGAIFFFENKTVLHGSLISGAHPPLWAGALASLYGGVNEEVLLRLFLFTLIYFLFSKAMKIRGGNRLPILWSVNLLVALLFGAGHLPVALPPFAAIGALEMPYELEC